MAPELGEAGALDRDGASADIFAVAVLLAEVLTGDEPFADARNDVAIALRVRDGERPALPKSTPRQLREALMRCWDSNSAARPDAKDLLLDVLDLRLDNDASTVRDDDGVEVVRVTTTTGCKQLSSVLAEQGLRDVIPIVRENEVDIEAARLMDNEDWQEIGLDQRAARNVVASLGTDSIRLKVRTPDGEVVELTTQTSTTVRELLRRLEDEYDCGVERARLFRCGGDKSGAALREENSLFDERVRKNCELDLKRGRSPPYGVPFPLYIRDLTGGAQSTLQLTVESCFTLKALMQLALETRSPPVSVEDDWRYRLEWCGKHLFASETVLDRCDIPKDATIILVPRVHALVR